MIVIWMYASALFQLTYCSGQFRYAVRNGVYAPTFNYEQDMDLVGNNTLVYYMNKACDIYPDTFTNYVAKYFPGLGYSIESINGQTGDWQRDKTYWQIRNDSGPLPLGVSSYVPSNGERILFNLTVFEPFPSHQTFTYTVNNGIKAPYFTHTVDLFIIDDKPLVYYMSTACQKYPDIFTTYSATYFPSFGYFIDAINGVAADWDADKSYWRILNFSQPLSVGVSSYVPREGDEIIFNLTIYEEQQSTEHDATTEAPTNMSSAPTYISPGSTIMRSSASVITTTSTPATTTTTTSVAGPKFRYTVLNMMVKPYFSHSVHLRIEDKQPLIYYMEKACDKYPKTFRNFTVSFLQSFNGYFVDAINDVFGNWYENETFWLILNDTGPVDLGVSSYIPTPGDDITFRFVHGNDYLPNHNKTSQPPNTCNCSCNVPIGGQPLTKQPSFVTLLLATMAGLSARLR
ncbi:uncharacterized protein LOC128206444 isoform X2 [Mya arenaria]|uniref:uncharacterized protein LOC128206444 isoform X2 n=1 Tax=Mya arenaria TaxID=6604 RepID=UPI0022E60073|nr:uncharacterized protein LOC128206444 isoform X2 [Mya arenaria]